MDEPGTPPGDVESFWELAKFHAGLNPAPSYFGPTSLESVQPPAFSLGEDPAGADAAVQDLIASEGASLTTPRDAFEHDADLPVVGNLGIVVDGEGHPHVLVETTDVRIEDGLVTEDLRVVYSA